MLKRLSIIVPVYNVESYLERCLLSLEDQDIPKDEYEVICVNDGSPDNSRNIVLRLQKVYNNIILIDQDNQGVSIARNHGIDVARGEYLLMVDSDDYVKPCLLKRLLMSLKDHDLDIGITGYAILDEDFREEYHYNPLFDQEKVIKGIDFFNIYQKGKSEIRDPHRSWAIFFKTSFINSNNLRYLGTVSYLEDGEIMARIICLANNVKFINEIFYFRTTRPGSVTYGKHFYSEKARRGFLKSAYNLLEFRNNFCKNTEQKEFMNQSIVQFTLLYLISLEGFRFLKKYSKLYIELKKGPLRILETTGCSDFYARMGKAYNVSILCLYLYWLFFRLRKFIKLRLKNLVIV